MPGPLSRSLHQPSTAETHVDADNAIIGGIRHVEGHRSGRLGRRGALANTPAAERLDLLKRVRRNIDRHFDELVGTDVRANGFVPGTATLAHREGTSVRTVIVPMAANVSAAIELYGSLLRKDPLKPLGVTSPGNGRFDIRVSPRGGDAWPARLRRT